jgi:hypothetical protein
LGQSPYRDKFALKGATLFTLWTGHAHRPTKDLDLLGQGSSIINLVKQTVIAICGIQADDGIVFDAKSVEGSRIKEDDEYDGVRIKFHAHLAEARIPMQVDIGLGDAFYPDIQLASFPVLLPMEAALIRPYPRETSIAEKFHAMVVLDIRNSRMKDFYDICETNSGRRKAVQIVDDHHHCLFRDSMSAQRCLIPVDGFYEWPRNGKIKQPYCFEGGDGELLAFAGLWDRWINPHGEEIESCTIITTTREASRAGSPAG